MKLKYAFSPLALIIFTLPVTALGADSKSSPSPASPPVVTTTNDPGAEAERINVEKIKEKYWARGDESELGVVQNRLYSKAKKVEFGVFGGVLSGDPFLSTKMVGGSVGYHFNEYFSIQAFGWKDFVSNSSAKDALESGTSPKRASTNEPRSYYGTEAVASLLYGKLSVVGKAIIYYDLHLLGGFGLTQTEFGDVRTQTGSRPTFHAGIGQQFYLGKRVSLRADYRAMRYTERDFDKEAPVETAKWATPIGDRTNVSHTFILGISILIGGD